MPKFRVLRGTFSMKVNGQRPPVIYQKGEVFETARTDLLARNNPPGGKPRLEPVPDSTPVTPAKPGIRARSARKAQEAEPARPPASPPDADTYDSMTVEQLRAHAAAEEITLGAAKTKAEIIAALRAANAG